MRTANLANEAVRQAEVGHVWVEVITNSQTSIEVPLYSTFRVRASNGTTVTIDGILAMTMSNGEIAVFNAGSGDPSDTKTSVTVAIGGANAYVQLARDNNRKL